MLKLIDTTKPVVIIDYSGRVAKSIPARIAAVLHGVSKYPLVVVSSAWAVTPEGVESVFRFTPFGIEEHYRQYILENIEESTILNPQS